MQVTLQRRHQLLQDGGVPTHAEVYKQIGPELANCVFKSLHGEEKIFQQMIPRVVEKKCNVCENNIKWRHFGADNLKTITHKAIINLGEQYLRYYEHQFEEEKERAIAVETDIIKYESQRRCSERIEAFSRSEQKRLEKRTAMLLHFFSLSSAEIVSTIQKEMRRVTDKKIGRERAELAALLEDKMKFAVEETLKAMQAKLEEQKRMNTENTKHMLFVERMKLTHHKYAVLKEAEKRHQEETGLLKNQLETKQFYEISDIIKTEQEKCVSKLRDLAESFKIQKLELKTTIEQNETKITELHNDLTEARDDVSAWETKAKLILQEFQKFINYVHNVVEGQADHMLSIDRLTSEDMQKLLASFLPVTDIKPSYDNDDDIPVVKPTFVDAAVQTKEEITADKSAMTEIRYETEVTAAITDARTSESTEISLEDETAQTVSQVEQFFKQVPLEPDETISALEDDAIVTPSIDHIDLGEIQINLSDEPDINKLQKMKTKDELKTKQTEVHEEDTVHLDMKTEILYEDYSFPTSKLLMTKIPDTPHILAESHDNVHKLLTHMLSEIFDELTTKLKDTEEQIVVKEKFEHDKKFVDLVHKHVQDILQELIDSVQENTHYRVLTHTLLEAFDKALTRKIQQDSEADVTDTQKYIQKILHREFDKVLRMKIQEYSESDVTDTERRIQEILQILKEHSSLMYMIIS